MENGGFAPHNSRRSIGDTLVKNAASVLAVVALLASVALAGGAGAATRKMYKWVDNQGVTHYGDQIPPEYASQEQHIINAQGVEIDRRDAEKSAAQVAAEEQQKIDAEQTQNRDRNLLNTYVSIQEIERLRDQRLTLLSDQIKVTSQFLEILNGRLRKLRTSSMVFKPYNVNPNAQPMPDQLAEDLVRVGNDIRTQEQNLRQKRTEETSMRQQFESDINRFKELKGTAN
jgi:hypothetical protein